MYTRRLAVQVALALLIVPFGGCLLELLTVTAIEGELHAKSAQSATRALDKARTVSSSTSLQQAVNAYAAEHGNYPPNLAALAPEYINPIPKRSDGTAYSYDAATGMVGGASGAVATVAAPVNTIAQQDAQAMEQIRQAINRYGRATGYYPPSLQALVQHRYLTHVPKAQSGLDFLYYSSNGALQHPSEFVLGAPAPSQQPVAQAVPRVPAGAAGGGLVGEAVAGIGVQNQLNNMNNSGVSAVRGNARRNIDGTTQDYSQRQEQAVEEFLP